MMTPARTLIIHSLLATNFLLMVPHFRVAQAESEGGNPYGFTIVGDFTQDSAELVLPEVDETELEKMRREVLATAVPVGLDYQSLFKATDRLALEQAEVMITAKMQEVAWRIAHTKDAFVRGVVALKGLKGRVSNDQYAMTAETYRTYMRQQYTSIILALQLENLGNNNEVTPVLYHKNAAGKVDGIWQPKFSSCDAVRKKNTEKYWNFHCISRQESKQIFGSADLSEGGILDLSFEREYVYRWSQYITNFESIRKNLTGTGWEVIPYDVGLKSIAQQCATEACVFEIQRAANELIDQSLEFTKKVKFQNNPGQLKIFFNAQGMLAKSAFAKVVEENMSNRNRSVWAHALAGLTTILGMAPLVPGEFLDGFRAIRITLNFRSTEFSDTRLSTAYLMFENEFRKIALQKLYSAIEY